MARARRCHHRPRRMEARATDAASRSPARAALRHMPARCRVVATGSGGRPYTSGSSSSRKNAPKPPTPSSGSRRRGARSFQPCVVEPARAGRLRALAQLVERAELDRLGRARLRARGLEAVLQPVVAERALPGRALAVRASDLAAVDHAERARGDAVAAAVADVLLHDDGAELGAEERAGRADVEAARRGCSACRRRSSSASGAAPGPPLPSTGTRELLRLLDERDVPPGVGAELAGVVVATRR